MKIIAKLLCLLALVWAAPAFAQPASCSAEKALQGRTDILHCEGWEVSTWWQNGYMDDGEKTSPTAASGPDQTEIVTTGCISGNCLKVNCWAYNNGMCGGMLAHHWPIPGTQQEVYLRYYLKLESNWSPENYCGNAGYCGTLGANVDNGGKFPGLADVRTSADASGQCGNGGAFSDGLNCWSGRLKYRNCTGSGGADICAASSSETTRLGWYWYLPPSSGNNNQAFGAFDNQDWGTDMAGAGGTCASDPINIGGTNSDSTSCGKGAAGLKNGVWYRVELRIKMNTAGTADGIAEAYIAPEWSGACRSGSTAGCGVLKYRKTNVKFRETGHDGLHVRTVWLDVHMGGEFVGPLTDSAIYLDQMVVATKAWPGAFKSSGSFVSRPFNAN